jgi:hypothetical protein
VDSQPPTLPLLGFVFSVLACFALVVLFIQLCHILSGLLKKKPKPKSLADEKPCAPVPSSVVRAPPVTELNL